MCHVLCTLYNGKKKQEQTENKISNNKMNRDFQWHINIVALHPLFLNKKCLYLRSKENWRSLRETRGARTKTNNNKCSPRVI
jgi:hypothetical protein